jgi:predicted aconitase
MHLTREEEQILNGEKGEGSQRAIEILVSIGEMNDSVKLIDVKSVQISGVSYKTIGDAGLDFLKDFASLKAKAKVFSTLNPSGVDLERDNEKVPKNFLEKQREIIKTYKSLGAIASCTCTPYLAGNLPSQGDHIAWAESSAVAYANSVIGAYTNRESAITALASSIIGKTPLYGLQIDSNRSPTFIVNVPMSMRGASAYSALGYYVGKNFDGIPLFKGITPVIEEFKALSAGLATGNISMFHVNGATPNVIGEPDRLEKIDFTSAELETIRTELNTCDEPDIICIGCPHCTVDEVKQVIAENPKKEVWVYTARQNRDYLIDKIKNPNISIISDTCMVVQPLEEMGISSLGTNSTKCAYYSKNLSGLDVRFDTMKNLLKS